MADSGSSSEALVFVGSGRDADRAGIAGVLERAIRVVHVEAEIALAVGVAHGAGDAAADSDDGRPGEGGGVRPP